jgi:hypothetical protein
VADSKKVRKVITLTAGAAALSLSATAITVLERTDLTNREASAVQKALGDGVAKAQASADKSAWIGLASRAMMD